MKSKFHIQVTKQLAFSYMMASGCGCEDKYVKHYETSKGPRTVRIAKEKCAHGQRAYHCNTLVEIFNTGKLLGKKSEKLLGDYDALLSYLREFNIPV